MKQRYFAVLGTLLTLCAAGCERKGEESIRRLIGDGNLTAVAVGRDETVIVSLVRSKADAHEALEYELAPDGQLAVRRYLIRSPVMEEQKATEEASETIRLPTREADELRRRFAPYRPARMAKDWPGVLPKDCAPITDVTARAVVLFHRPDNRGGLFELQSGCDNANARSLKADISQIVSTIPKAKPAAGFDW